MNIFALDENAASAAMAHCDAHVVKMILETTQILSTVCSKTHDTRDWHYVPTHKNHPCVKWAGESLYNYCWLVDLGLSLCKEYTFRYEKTHACHWRLQRFATLGLPSLSMNPLSPWALAMPDNIRSRFTPDFAGSVQAYRAYYETKRDTMPRFKYTKRPPPPWLPEKSAPLLVSA